LSSKLGIIKIPETNWRTILTSLPTSVARGAEKYEYWRHQKDGHPTAGWFRQPKKPSCEGLASPANLWRFGGSWWLSIISWGAGDAANSNRSNLIPLYFVRRSARYSAYDELTGASDAWHCPVGDWVGTYRVFLRHALAMSAPATVRFEWWAVFSSSPMSEVHA